MTMNAVVFSFLCLTSIPQEISTFKAVQARDSDFMGEIDDGPTEVMPGCSWYCGGFVSSFDASSTLPVHKGILYSAENAHDFDVTTAWVEGKADDGIGEFLEYTFDMTSFSGEHHLGITTIVLANGYKKSRQTWEENSRIRKLKMYVDDNPYGYLELLDSFEFQTIDIGKIMLPQKKIMKFRFEIVEVYRGTKYRDTAISELLFDGIGVH